MTLNDLLSGAVPPAPKPKAKKNKARTKAATKARQKAYDLAIRKIVPTLKEIRSHGFTSAAALAEFLTYMNVPSPSGNGWTKSALLRALCRLRELGLEPKMDLPGNPLDPLHGGYLDLNKPAHIQIWLKMQAQAKAEQLAGTAPPEAPPMKPVYGSPTSI